MKKRLKQEYFLLLKKTLAELFPLQARIEEIMINTELKLSQADMQGSGEKIWNSVLVLAEDKDKIPDLTSFVLGEYPGNGDLMKCLNAISNGDAFINKIRYEDYINPLHPDALKVFLVYDKENKDYVEKLKQYLSSLVKYEGSITLSDPHEKLAGTNNNEEFLLTEIGNSQIMLLILTPAFMGNTDNNCDWLSFAGKQMGKRVIPVLMEDCDWKRIRLISDIVPLPTNGEFILNQQNKSRIMTEVTKQLGALVKDITGA